MPRPTVQEPDAGADAAAQLPGDDSGTGMLPTVGSCNEKDLSLGWPVAGERAVAWEVSHYFDLDPGPGTRDFTGATGANAKTYDGHPGIDVSIADFRAMDAGIDVLAVADGKVADVVDGFFDRDKTMEQPICQTRQNYIAIVDQKSGYRHEYLHIRKGSAKVRIGDRIERGQAIALVGSSGCSIGPHVHLNVLDCVGVAIDPFERGLFESAPAYEAPLDLMNSVFSNEPIATIDDIADPGVEASTHVAGQTLGFGVVIGAGKMGDVVELVVKRPDDSVFARLRGVLGPVPRLTYSFWNVLPDAAQGTWTFEALHESRSLVQRTLPITRKVAPTQHLFLRATEGEVAVHIADERDLGFSPRIIDGYNTGTEARFNLVFEAGENRRALRQLTGSDIRNNVTNLAKEGLAPVQVDAYSDGDTLRFAAVFAPAAGIESYFDASAAEHNTNFSAQTKAGRMPISIAIVDDSMGTVHVAASYAENPNLTLQARFGVSGTDLDTRATSELAARRFPILVHASDLAANTRYSAVFTSWDPGDYVLARDLTEAQLLMQHASRQASGMALASLSATQTADGVRYAALWLAQARFQY